MHPLLVPIQVGAALADSHFAGFVHDDEGENISVKNRSYCELTSQYWAWKNVEADYYGFFHYRRYLYPDMNAKRPYRLDSEPTVQVLEKLGYERFAKYIEQYDLIVPKGENMYVPVRKHYADASFHHGKDLEIIEEIIRERFPAYIPAMEEYLSGTVCYFGNIFIMKRPVFQDYCGWLFSILEEFDRRTDVSGYSAQELRVDGYLAERLLGVYLTHVRQSLRVLELPRVHFGGNMKNRIIYHLLPPGTKRRAAVKSLGRKL